MSLTEKHGLFLTERSSMNFLDWRNKINGKDIVLSWDGNETGLESVSDGARTFYRVSAERPTVDLIAGRIVTVTKDGTEADYEVLESDIASETGCFYDQTNHSFIVCTQTDIVLHGEAKTVEPGIYFVKAETLVCTKMTDRSNMSKIDNALAELDYKIENVSVTGETGLYSFEVEGDDLIVYYTGTEPDFYIDENGHLIAPIDDDNFINLGRVVGGDGVGIQSIERTAGDGSPGSTDTYTITLTNGNTSTIQIYNGKDGDGLSEDVIGRFESVEQDVKDLQGEFEVFTGALGSHEESSGHITDAERTKWNAIENVDAVPTEGSTNLISSGAVYNAIQAAIRDAIGGSY